MNIKWLSSLFIMCLLVIFVIDFTEFKITVLIKGKANETENLIHTLCIAYVASFIFYFLNVYLKERKEKNVMLPFIASKVIGIIVNNLSIIDALRERPLLSSLKDLPNEAEFKILLSRIDPNQNPSIIYKDKTWMFLLNNRRESTLNSIETILLTGKHLDEELKVTLLKIQKILYTKDCEYLKNDSCPKKSLEEYSRDFHRYFNKIQDLNTYYEKNLKTFYKKLAK